MPKILTLILVCIISIFLSFSSPVSSRGNCWGIFKNKAECEAEYRYKRDLKVCRENAQDLCRKFINNKGSQYCGCIDRVLNSCMSSLGGGYYGLSACDDGDVN